MGHRALRAAPGLPGRHSRQRYGERYGGTSRNRGDTALVEANARASLLEQRISDLKTILDDMRTQRDDLREQRDAWQRQAEASQRVLTNQRDKTEAPQSWWQWLRHAA